MLKPIISIAIAAFISAFCFWTYVKGDQRSEESPPAPVSLSNPDGQNLDLEKYDLRVAVHGALALVEMEMTFRNPQNRQMEGRFLYLLPPDATISRFAKEVDGKLMEGEVVERQSARSVYREILHTMRDPALVEQDQGNRFSARVFPIPAAGRTRLALSFTQVLTLKNGVRELRIPMAGMPKIGEFRFQPVIQAWPGESIEPKTAGTSGDPSQFAILEKDYTPAKDLILAFQPQKGAPRFRTLRAGDLRMIAYQPEIKSAKADPDTKWVFYIDSSASNVDTEARRLEAIAKLLGHLDARRIPYQAFAFDLDVAPLSTASSKAHQDPHLDVCNGLRARHMLGATDLEKTIRKIGAEARADPMAQRFVLVSDGIASWGTTELEKITAAMGEWPENDTLHALVLGNKQDTRTLTALTEKGHGRIAQMGLDEHLDGQVKRACRDLENPRGAKIRFEDANSEWMHPCEFKDVQPGQELIVFQKLKQDLPGGLKIHQIAVDGPKNVSEPDTHAVEVKEFAPLLVRESYRSYLDLLDRRIQAETDGLKRGKLLKEQLNVSVSQRVLCPRTALLVLETEHDYQRFGIQRNARADILLVGKKGIEWKKRSDGDLAPIPVPITHRTGTGQEKKKSNDLKNGNAAKKAEKEGREPIAPEAPAKTPGRKDGAEPAEELQKEVRSGKSNSDSDDNLDLAEGGEPNSEDLDDTAATHPFSDPTASSRAAAGENSVTRQPSQGRTRPAQAPVNEREQESTDAARPTESRGVPRFESVLALTQPKTANATWISQYGKAPTDEQLSQLRALIADQPRDRRLRNNLSEALMKAGNWDSLQAEAFEWLPFDPENPQIYEFLGNSASHLKNPDLALRAMTSIAEVAPHRSALLARTGWLLLTVKKYDWAERMFKAAIKERDDHPNFYRGLALSQWLNGDYQAATATLEGAGERAFNSRYGDLKQVFKEELGYIYRAWLARASQDGKDAVEQIRKRGDRSGIDWKQQDALRITLCWETDANDVDLHVVDPSGEECFYSNKRNRSGLELYSDQTQGLGPEVIRSKSAEKGLYHVGVKYYNAGPMGVSRAVVVAMKPRPDGMALAPEILPFCLVPDGQGIRHLTALEF